MWSETCSYKSSRVHLRKFPTSGPRVVQGPGENAGVIDIGDGWVAAFKMESHNHPSYIEPYQGAATGVGGILRDIFTMGARPIACLDSLRFGDLDAPRMKYLVDGVVRGISGYGNCIGIPTIGGETSFHRSYNGNILVNVFALGVTTRDRIFTGTASGVGNPVIYVGSKTGREDEVVRTFEKWDLNAAVVGEVTDDGFVRLVWRGEEVAAIPVDPISTEAPVYERPMSPPERAIPPSLDRQRVDDGDLTDELL